ncbi:MAG TPA: two-component regulator propeller domain-containing protein [Verrucomicrobiae bacterium]|jgi:ligand-binding sensor domain-containing protein/signal transduction histidine kinase
MQIASARASYEVDVWQIGEGLPQGTVTSIAQTGDGYLWLGTQNGLARFDGVSFKVFNENNVPAIKNNRIVQLFVDRADRLWIGAEQGNLVCYQNGLFTAYETPGKGTSFNYARVFCDDPEGGLWVISCEWQLTHLKNGVFQIPSADWHLSGVRPDAVASDQSGQVWVGTEKELARLQNGTFQTVYGQTNEENFQVEFLAKSRTGGIWVAGNKQLRKFESGHWTANLGSYAWTNSPVYGLYEDSLNRLWVATLGDGLFRYDADGTVLHLTTKDGLPSDFVRCVTEDREGNIWAGMEGGGLCRLKPAIFQTLGVRQGLSSDQVMSMCEASDGSFWIGLNGAGLDHLSNGQVTNYGTGQGLLNGHVWSVVQDQQGTLWLGTWDGLFKSEQNHFTGLSDGLTIGWEVLAIYSDSQSNLWLGQQSIGAVTKLHGSEHTPVMIAGASSSLDVRVIVQDHAGNFWIGTENDGLYCLQNGRCLHFDRKDGLASESIWSLRADDDGTVWIGTCGGGLSRWRNGKITTWTAKNGLVNDVICQILEDRAGNLWLGSYGGIFQISRHNLDASVNNSNLIECVSYNKSDGLPSTECAGGFQPSGCRSADGRLWFPTVKGFAIVDPEKIPHNSLVPPVVIESLMVDKTMLWPKSGLAESGSPGTVEIPPGRQRLEFQYTALSLTAPKKVRFKCKLEGLENHWQDMGENRSVEYSRLPPGTYHFDVIACNNDGVWNNAGAILTIKVLPYFWQTRWFMALAILTILGSVAGSVRYVVKQKLQRRIEHVERERAIEAERSRIANDIHDDLGSGLTEIVILSELAQSAEIPTDDIQADVRKITSKARALTQSLDEIVWAMNLQNDTLDSFVTYTCNFAQEYLQLAKIRCRLDLPAQLPNVPLTADIRHNLFMVLKETLNNIVKHAHASEVWIQVTIEPKRFILSMRDNGSGFPLELAPDSQAGSEAQNANLNVGKDGLVNMRKRLKNIGGQLSIQSRQNLGTQIELTLPLPDL